MKNKFEKTDMLLVMAALILLLGYFIIDNTKVRVADKWYDEKLAASKLMQEAENAVKKEKEKKGLFTDKKYDINETGIIGQEWSFITTTLGSIEAKRTATNPNFAAIAVDMMKELGLKAGDSIAVNFSGSFPALNIAVLSAIQTLNLEPVIISSAGASAWGANDPDFTYIDMEDMLYEEGILRYKSEAVSVGGSDDIGKGMGEEEVKAMLGRFEKQGRRIIYQPDMRLNMAERLAIYNSSTPVRCFINVGGNLAASGGDEDFTRLNTGIIKEGAFSGRDSDKGLIHVFLEKDVPVINLLNIKKLAVQYGLPVDPYPLPEIGEGEVYYDYSYSLLGSTAVLAAAMALTAVYSIKARSKYE